MKINIKLKYTMILFAATFSLVTISAANAANAASVKIENADFEKGFENWIDTEPSAISRSNVHSGEKAAKITASAGKFEQSIIVSPETDYELSAYITGSGKIGALVGGTKYTSTITSSSYDKAIVAFNSGSATSITIFGDYHKSVGRFDDFALKSISTKSSNFDSNSWFR